MNQNYYYGLFNTLTLDTVIFLNVLSLLTKYIYILYAIQQKNNDENKTTNIKYTEIIFIDYFSTLTAYTLFLT